MKFTLENTTGYTAEQLAELNEKYIAAIAELDEHEEFYRDECSRIAEKILAEI